jgi:hypothetical protein
MVPESCKAFADLGSLLVLPVHLGVLRILQGHSSQDRMLPPIGRFAEKCEVRKTGPIHMTDPTLAGQIMRRNYGALDYSNVENKESVKARD